MKNFKNFCYILIVMVFVTSCSNGVGETLDSSLQNDGVLDARAAKLQEYNQFMASETSGKSASILGKSTSKKNSDLISYKGELCGDRIYAEHENARTRGDASKWDYYSFRANAGDIISIAITRVSSGMDPAAYLYFGTTNSSDGIDSSGNAGPELEYIEEADDEFEPDSYSCWGDPVFEDVELPYSGMYTIAIYDYFSCTNDLPLKYMIEPKGIICDYDDDGFYGTLDEHPNSIMTETIFIHTTDTEIKNENLGKGTYMADLIQDVVVYVNENYRNASTRSKVREFERRVHTVAGEWYVARLITSQQRLLLDRIASQATELFN